MGWRHFLSSLRARSDRARPSQPDLAAVRRAELDLILGRETPGAADADDAVSPWGLALSGGGVRSATFSLGVLQALARSGMLSCFHYQSTVSGGGYVGAFLQALIRRQGFVRAFAILGGGVEPQAQADDRNRAAAASDRERAAMPPELRHLREYGNYLSPHGSVLSGDTLGMIGTYARNVLLIQLQLCALLLAITLLPLLLYAGFAHLSRHWPNLPALLSGWFGLLATALLAYVTTSVNRRVNVAGAKSEAPPGRIVFAAAAAIACLALAALTGAVGIADFRRLPAWIDALAEFPLTLAAGLAPIAAAAIRNWGADPVHRLAVASGLFYFMMWSAWLLLDALYAGVRRNVPVSPQQRYWRRYLAAAFVAAALVGCAVLLTRAGLANASGERDAGHAWGVLVFGPCLTLLSFSWLGMVHVGLAGPALSDLQREIWARVGGKTAALVVLGMTSALALTVYGPWLLSWLWHVAWSGLGDAGWVGWVGWAGVAIWAAVSLAGVLIGVFANRREGIGGGGDTPSAERRNRWRRGLALLVRVAPWVFALGLLAAMSAAGQWILQLLGWSRDLDGLQDVGQWQPGVAMVDWRGALQAYLHGLDIGIERHGDLLWLTIALAIGVWLSLGWVIDANAFSLSAFYRNRLVRCYLGAGNTRRNPEPITNLDPGDDIALAEVVRERRLHGGRPLYPLIGATLNLVAAKQLDWHDRKAASFCLSPGFCGHLPPDWRPQAAVVGDSRARAGATALAGDGHASLATELSLGSAIAISGAALNPNMGDHGSPAIAFLLTLFDARLGWWLPNLNHPRPPAAGSAPFFGGWLLAELLGRTDQGGRHVHLSDGGHFENLGLYELVRRRCRFILSVDASSDPYSRFADLGNAVLKCRLDFGADIRIDVSALHPDAEGRAARGCAVGDIFYADGSRGVLLYLKPVLTGDEPVDVACYADGHQRFPHEPIADQFFNEAQFESYRRLGEDAMMRALTPALERIGAGAHAELGLRDCERKERFLTALVRHWAPRMPGRVERFSVHGAALTRLYAQLRRSPELAVLDAQLHSAWTDLMPPDAASVAADAVSPTRRRTRLPADRDFRACFYFCQQLIRLMESVYHDLDLERGWSHPDNRGWMNTFRNWSWVPMFRIAWTIGAPGLGVRFVTFCQQRLAMPRLEQRDGHGDVLRLCDVSPAADVDWAQHCQALAEAGMINHVEASLLRSAPVWRDPGERPQRLLLLRLRWSRVLPTVDGRLPETTLGVAVLGQGRLRLLRIQGHLRQLGLGTEFMRILLRREPIEGIDIRGGDYGLGGVHHAHAVAARLQRMWQRSQHWRRTPTGVESPRK